MRLLTVVFASPEEFLRHYSEAYPSGALFCRTRTTLSPGEAILVDVSFPGPTSRSLLRGCVVSTISGKGAWVRFRSRDHGTASYLVRYARGEAQQERSHTRYPADVPVACRVDELEEPTTEPARGQVCDLGVGGAYVVADAAPAVGTRLRLVIGPMPRQGETFTVEGRVAWVQGDSPRGFGVRFDRRGEGERRLRSMLRRASELGHLDFADH